MLVYRLVKQPKLILVGASGLLLFAVVAGLVLRQRSKSVPIEPQFQLEAQAQDGPVSVKSALERVELVTQFEPTKPSQGISQVRVRQLDQKGQPGMMVAMTNSFEVYRPQGVYLELLDLDGDLDKEIVVAVGVSPDKGELRIYDLQGKELIWFCRLPEQAACLFGYQHNRPEAVDLDGDQVAEVVVYGPQPLGSDQFNFDRYSVYRVYLFSQGAYFEADGAKLEELTEAFARYSRLPLVPAQVGL